MEIRWEEEECRFSRMNQCQRSVSSTPLSCAKRKKKKKLEIFQVMLDALLNTSKRGILSINRLKEKEKYDFHIRRDKKWDNFYF